MNKWWKKWFADNVKILVDTESFYCAEFRSGMDWSSDSQSSVKWPQFCQYLVGSPMDASSKIGFQYVLQWCCLVTSVPYPTQNEPNFFPESHPEFFPPFYPKRPCALRTMKKKHTIISWSFHLDKAILARDLHSFSERAQILKHLSLILTILPSLYSVSMLTLELSSYVFEIPNYAYTTLSQFWLVDVWK